MKGSLLAGVEGERAARFRHLHEAEHALVHARAARGGDDDDGGAIAPCAYSIDPRDAFADDGAHRGGEKTEIHHCDPDLVTFDERVAAENGVDQSGVVLIFAQTILVARHALEFERVDGSQAGVEFDEAVGIAKIRDPLLGRLREMIIAARADAVVFRQLDFVHDFAAAGALLPKALRHLAFLAALGLERWFFENGHVLAAGGSRRVHRKRTGFLQNRGAFAQSRTGREDVVD